MSEERKPWTRQEEILLIEMYEANLGAEAAARKLGRNVGGVQTHMSRLRQDLTLPYALRKRAKAAILNRGPRAAGNV